LKLLTLSAVLGALLGISPAPVTSHRVLLRGADAKFEMDPDDLEAKPGDSVVFQVKDGAPHALGIDPTGMPAEVREAWNRALPRRVGDLRGPLIRLNDTYVIVVPRGIPKGTYHIFCSPHRAYDEDLDLQIK
jgi:plastocyanin